MKKLIPALAIILSLCGSALVAGCATQSAAAGAALYDFGPLPGSLSLNGAPSGKPAPSLPPISIADIGTPGWLDSTMMFFRLNYANDQQPRPYANSRWIMPPMQLFEQRLKSRIAQAGGAALPASAGAADVPVLRIEADDFTQSFSAPGQSVAQVGLRAAVFNGRALVAQKSFLQRVPAPSADAVGGARALATASDAVITEMMAWLASLPSPMQAAK